MIIFAKENWINLLKQFVHSQSFFPHYILDFLFDKIDTSTNMLSLCRRKSLNDGLLVKSLFSGNPFRKLMSEAVTENAVAYLIAILLTHTSDMEAHTLI